MVSNKYLGVKLKQNQKSDRVNTDKKTVAEKVDTSDYAKKTRIYIHTTETTFSENEHYSVISHLLSTELNN